MKLTYAFLLPFLPLMLLGRELPVGGAGEMGMSEEGLAKVGSAVERLISEKKLVGANVLVMRKGQIVYEKSFGLQDASGESSLPRRVVAKGQAELGAAGEECWGGAAFVSAGNSLGLWIEQ